MIKFRFDSTRTLQAIGILIQAHNGVVGRSRLMPLLYMADRLSLTATGRIITGDRAVATNQGPLLVRAWKMIKRGESRSTSLERCIVPHGSEVVLQSDPGRGQLTRQDVELLGELLDRYRGISTCGLWAVTRGYPEYLKSFEPDQIKPITWDAVLAATTAPELAESFQASHDEQALIDSIFGAMNDAGG